MKLVNKTLRLSLIVVFGVSAAIFAGLIIYNIKNTGFQEVSSALYSYKNNMSVNYLVYLRPNILFEETVLGEGQLYFTEFTDNILANFNYRFWGDDAAEIYGSYNIAAIVEGYALDEEKKPITLWKKNFEILPEKDFQMNSSEIDINEELQLELGEYIEFAKNVIEATKVRVDTKLSLLMSIDLKANTAMGLIEESSSASIILPLDQQQFIIQKSQPGEQAGKIEEKTTLQLPVDARKIKLLSIPLVVFVLCIIFLAFFTKNQFPLSKMERLQRKIFKNHGNRLIAFIDSNENVPDKNIRVKSIEDLVKIADELERPIMYKFYTKLIDVKQFFVICDNMVYILDLDYIFEGFDEKVKVAIN